MADESEDPKPQESELENPNPNPKFSLPPPSMTFPSLSLNIWPPSQRTRDAVTHRLVETLSSPSSVISKRYGAVPHDDAVAIAEEIEKEAFASAESSSDEARSSSVDGGLEILEIYSKAISRKMLESVKAGGLNPNPNPQSVNDADA